MAPKAKAKRLVVPSPARAVDPADERISDTGLSLLEAIRKAEAEGLSRLRHSGGAPDATTTPDYIKDLLNEPDTIRQIIDLVKQHGMTRFLPLARGAESSVFDTNAGKVLKLGPQDRRFFSHVEPDDYVPPTGVWGVLPATRDRVLGQDHSTPGGPYRHDWNIWTQPRVITTGIDHRDADYLTNAIAMQGYKWDDGHAQNVGLLPGAGYNPVVIDGPVLQRPGVFASDGSFVTQGQGLVLPGKNFQPPSVRPWVLAALAAGGAGALSLANQGVAGASELPQLITSGASPPPVPPAPPSPESQIPASSIYESVFGTDLDMSSFSPREVYRWENDPKYGYGGDVHRQYIANADKVMDMPVVPRNSLKAIMGMLTPPSGETITVRDLIKQAPTIAEIKAQADFINDLDNPEKEAAYEHIRQLNEQYAKSGEPHPMEQEVYNAFTAQRHDRSSPYIDTVVNEILGAVKAGTTGGKFEDDPSISQSDMAEWQAKYGEEANRMLTPGGVKNAQREMVYDFLSAAQSGSHLNPHFNNTAYLTAMVAPGATAISDPAMGGKMRQRREMLEDPSAYRGRMDMANLRLATVLPTFEAHAANPEKPYVIEAKNFNRLDPGSYQGIMSLSENASWPYARNVYHPFQQFVAGVGERLALADGLLDTQPLQFQVDASNRSKRETPVRLDGEDYAANRATRAFVKDRDAAGAEYLSTHLPAAVADAANAFGSAVNKVIPHNTPAWSRNPNEAMKTIYSLPYAMATSPLNALSMAAGAVGKSPLLIAANLLKEGADEVWEDAVTDPANANPFRPAGASAWMRPNAMVPDGKGGMRKRTDSELRAMYDPDNKEAWDRGVEETKATRDSELRGQYKQWRAGTQQR